jgi:hypothetical protein
MSNYDPLNWYWSVSGNPLQVYSSARLAYVALTDSTYEAWLAAGNTPSKIDTDADLQCTLFQAGAMGLTVTSTGTPAINGTYATGPGTQEDINGIATYILENSSFPNAASTLEWLDRSGAPHAFPSTAVFQEFATNFANYVAAMKLFINGGMAGSVPSNSVTIA